MPQAALEELVDPNAELVRIGSGYWFTEGPVWDAIDGCLLFNDIPNDTRWRWSEQRGVEKVATPTGKSNGMAFEADGGLIVCEHVTSSVVRISRAGVREVIAFHYGGKYLNSPNDVTVRASDGGIYFTDPDWGRWNDDFGVKRSKELAFNGLFRVPAAGGALELLAEESEFENPNGLCFSPDESLLYVNDSPRSHIKVWDVAADGTLRDGRVFFGGIGTGGIDSAPDGMECDEQGNVWVTGPGGAWIISPDGVHLGTLEVPEVTGSLVWGGADRCTLFFTSSSSVFAVRTLVMGALLPNNH